MSGKKFDVIYDNPEEGFASRFQPERIRLKGELVNFVLDCKKAEKMLGWCPRVDFNEDTHRVRLDRPVMFPGVIGGHCLIPNIMLLLKVYGFDFLRLILESNERRIEEIKDRSVREEVEKIRKRVEKLEMDC